MTTMADQTYDVVVIGAGPVGENVADRAGRTGLSVAIVEEALVGGHCSYWACMPSKTLLRPGAIIAAARDVPGVTVDPQIDVDAVLAWRDRVVHDWDDAGQVAWLDSAGVTLLRGRGRLTGERRLTVTSEDGSMTDVEAQRAVVIASGSTASVPPVPGLRESGPWSSEDATTAKAVPRSLAIIGGGVVGVEMATAFAALGSTVTLLSRGPLLAAAEPWAGEAVQDALLAAGAQVVIRADLRQVERRDDGTVTVTYGLDGDERTLAAEQVLAATGRRPSTTDLGLETVGLDPDHALSVDRQTRVQGIDGDWLYAAGDVTGEVGTTHQGKYQGRVCGDVIAARFGPHTEGAPTHGDPVPAPDADPAPWSRYASTADASATTQVVFTDPQVSWVGLTEQAARDAGLDVRVVSYEMGDVAGATVDGEHYGGRAQIVVDVARRVIVGATFVGPDAGELLHAATIAVVGEVPLDRLWHAVPAYPTVSEIWLRFLESYGL